MDIKNKFIYFWVGLFFVIIEFYKFSSVFYEDMNNKWPEYLVNLCSDLFVASLTVFAAWLIFEYEINLKNKDKINFFKDTLKSINLEVLENTTKLFQICSDVDALKFRLQNFNADKTESFKKSELFQEYFSSDDNYLIISAYLESIESINKIKEHFSINSTFDTFQILALNQVIDKAYFDCYFLRLKIGIHLSVGEFSKELSLYNHRDFKDVACGIVKIDINKVKEWVKRISLPESDAYKDKRSEVVKSILEEFSKEVQAAKAKQESI